MHGEAGDALVIEGTSGTIRLERMLPGANGHRPDLAASCNVPWQSGTAVAVVDHGTVEVFVDGRAASMLCFPGLRWSLDTAGAATVVEARPAASAPPGDR